MIKTFSKKRIIKLCAIFLSIFILLSGVLSVYFSYLHRYKGASISNPFSLQDTFNIDSIVTLQKERDKDFVILNLTDIQLADLEDFLHRDILRREIDYLIKTAKPDLITLTGDQTWSNENLMSLKSIIRWLEYYKIPYAPVFGNHDCGNEFNSAVASQNYCCDLYEGAKHCLFSRGPSNLGCLGNYIINIMEGDKIYKTLYMLNAGYNDEITDTQIEWIKWSADGIKKANNNEYSSALCFMHKPIEEYAKAYFSYMLGNSNSTTEVLVDCSLYGVYDNGFYEVAKEIAIKHFICGHQHTNSFSINYDDCTFTFALKTGELSFYYDDGNINFNGGTVITLNESENVQNIYVDRNAFHIEGSTNTYEN